jgi:hypothetical protein
MSSEGRGRSDLALERPTLGDRVAESLLARPWIVLVLAMVVHTALFFAVQRDLATADPLYYARHAHDLAFDRSHLSSNGDDVVFAMRLGLTVPLGLLFRLFGASLVVTNLPSLFAGLGIMAIAYAAASTPRAKLLAVLFAMVCTPLLVDGRELTPDLPCGAVMAASILCLSRRDRPRGSWWVVGAAVAWFAAFQIKEVAVWCAPVWVYAILRDLRDRGARCVVRTFAPAIGVGVGLAAGYLVFCAVFWGDPVARFTGIEAAAAWGHDWSLVGHPTAEWVARLTWGPPALLFGMFRLAVIPVVLAPWLVRGRDRLWVVAAATIVLMFWFGSSTLSDYIPLPTGRRMVLPLVPELIVLSALATDAALERLRDVRWRLVLGLAFAVCLVYPHVNSIRKKVFVDRPETAAYAALRAEVASTTDPVVLLCGDFRCGMFADLHFGFEVPANLVVVNAVDFAAARLPERARVRLLVQLTRAGASRDAVRCAEALGLRKILWTSNVRLYDAEDGSRLRRALGSPLSSTMPRSGFQLLGRQPARATGASVR